MGTNSGIEWTTHTFNPWLGCTKVSPACTHCYAEVNRAVAAASARVSAPLWGPDAARVVTSDAYWRQPIAWDRAARDAGERHRVFCASLADVFEERKDLEGPRERLHQLVAKTPHLDWLLLTKRPEAVSRVPGGLELVARPNVWMGTTVEDQERAEQRIPHLLALPARVRFLSCEPLLGPVDLTRIGACRGEHLSALEEVVGHIERPALSWVIVGGESGGSYARPMHPEWARSIRDQCGAARVPFFMKQWGEWKPSPLDYPPRGDDVPREVYERHRIVNLEGGQGFHGECAIVMERVGKKAAGSLLDGIEHKAFPGGSR